MLLPQRDLLSRLNNLCGDVCRPTVCCWIRWGLAEHACPPSFPPAPSQGPPWGSPLLVTAGLRGTPTGLLCPKGAGARVGGEPCPASPWGSCSHPGPATCPRGHWRQCMQPPALTLPSPAHSTPHTHPAPTRPPCLPPLSHLPGGEPSENPQTQTKSPITLPLPQTAIVKSFGVCSCQPVTREYFTGGFCF